MRLLALSLVIVVGGCGRGQLAVGGGEAGDGPDWLGVGPGSADAGATAVSTDAGATALGTDVGPSTALDGPAIDAAPMGSGPVDALAREVEGSDGAAPTRDGDVFDGFVLDRSSADFGTLYVGQKSSVAFQLSYRYVGQPLLGIPVSGRPTIEVVGQDFVRGFSNCSPTAGILDGDSCTISVDFRPRGPGVRHGRLVISGRPGGIVSADLIGMADSTGVLEVTPSGSFEFPPTLVGKTTAEQAFTIRNVSGPEVVDLMVFFGDQESFTFFTDCPEVLPAGSSCRARVAFAPKEGGAAVASLGVTAGLQSLVVYLKGTGLTPPRLHIDPMYWNYGEGRVGEVVINPVGLRVGNLGSIATGVPAVAVEGPDAAEFPLSSHNCSAPLGPSCSVTVDFKPISAGTKSARLVVRADPGGQVATDLIGVAKP